MTLNDAKHAALTTLTGQTGATNDLERAYLLGLTGAIQQQTNGLWATRLRQLGYRARYHGLFDLLGDEGYAGDFNDRLYAFWLAGGVLPGSTTLVTVLNAAGDAYTPPLDILNSAGASFVVTTTITATDAGAFVIS